MTFIDKLCLEKCINIENENSYPLHWLDQSTELRTGTAGTCFSRTLSQVSCVQRLFRWQVQWGVIRGLENGLLFSQAMKGTASKKSIHGHFKSLQRQVKSSKKEKHPSHLLTCSETSKSRQTQTTYQSKRLSRHEISRCMLTVKL